MFEKRDGEIALGTDPSAMSSDGHFVFIGRIHSPWKSRADCPKNMAAARERGLTATVEIGEAFRPGLEGLSGASHDNVLSWIHHDPRKLIVQKPRHAAEPKGVFALRSPVRPNPVGLHVAKLLALDVAAGLLTLDAIDLLDGTPVIDIKPYFASIDAFPDAVIARRDSGE